MLFNSISFLIFLPVVFLLYWLVFSRHFMIQNILLLAASYFFYGSWDWRFLFLMLASTLIDYFSGIKIYEAKEARGRRIWLWSAICVNVGFLGLFKYYNFFAQSFSEALAQIGLQSDPWTLNLILPIGISFYTFHGLSYIIDIFNKRTEPERNFINYALFVSFFPLLVAGPIERASHLLPQLKRTRQFDYYAAVDGLRQILWGMFKKVAIADGCAQYVDMVFNSTSEWSASTRLLAAVFFSIQIYCDFSGYSDIALGTANLFGIRLLRNFAYPYFARDIAEFWRRWHISLTTWFRDYLYIPLGGSKKFQIRNTFIIFLVSGFWHGANWTFIFWGILNALFFLPLMLTKKNRINLDIVSADRCWPSFTELSQILRTFVLVTFAWIFFRAANLHEGFRFVYGLFSWSIFSKPSHVPTALVFLILVFIVIEWMGRHQQYAIEAMALSWPRYIRWGFYYCCIIATVYFSGIQHQFIYFQF